MKISELVEKLNEIKEREEDVEVMLFDEEYGHASLCHVTRDTISCARRKGDGELGRVFVLLS